MGERWFWPILNIVLMIAMFNLLSSCSHRVRRDGAPHFYVDETRIPNARPQPEPLSKYGNMKTYSVFGKHYHVMKSVKNFEEVGVASWYGTQFHARRTSSGERYNMLAMTAAHKTLPLPTYLEVTNLANQRKIIVKVNDRGPFAANRILDVSYVAAKKLGMLGRGTARVKIKAIDPYTFGKPLIIGKNTQVQTAPYHRNEQQISSKPLVVGKNTRIVQAFYLQVGAFRNRLNAEKLKNRLTSLLITPVKISATANTKIYRVQIGPIKDVGTANRITLQLRGLGLEANKTPAVTRRHSWEF